MALNISAAGIPYRDSTTLARTGHVGILKASCANTMAGDRQCSNVDIEENLSYTPQINSALLVGYLSVWEDIS